MAKAKPKKSGSKSKVKKKAAPARAPRRQPQQAPQPAPVAKKLTFPCTATVIKGAERIPVQLTDSAHHARLVEEFGTSCVEVNQ